MAMLRRHGDVVRRHGSSGANELLCLGGHTGTHIDALCHFSLAGKHGVPIIEVMDLEGLARDRARTFLVVAAPLTIVGAHRLPDAPPRPGG